MNENCVDYNAESYKAARPSYPSNVIDIIKKHAPFLNNGRCIEIGAGTGKFTELLITAGVSNLTCIEPNVEMLKFWEINGNFKILNCSCENIGIENECFDYFFFAQSLHWFANEKSRSEILRLSGLNSKYFVLWNELNPLSNSATKDYLYLTSELKMKQKKEIHTLPQRYFINKVFHNRNYFCYKINHLQSLDYNGMLNRFLSSSLTHGLDKQDLQKALNDLSQIFYRNVKKDVVTLHYNCYLYVL